MKITNLSKKIGQKQILEKIDFVLYPNEIVGLVGRNGSGKTTLFRTIADHYLPESGTITINDRNLQQDPALKAQIFYIDEVDNFLKAYSLKKIGEFYRAAYPFFDQDQFLALTKEHQLPLHLSYRRMSKGMQGLFQMILAISSNATYLLLDEPFDGLDVIIRKKVIGLLLGHIADGKRTAVIASHNLQELEGIIDRALLIKGQTIVKDYRLETMRETAKKFQMVFKTKKVPQIVKDNSKLIAFQGRVVVAVFENYDPQLAAKIMAEQPLVFEELPLSLEDLFEANLNKEELYR